MSVIIALLTTGPASLELEQAVDVKGNVVRTVKPMEERMLVIQAPSNRSRSVQRTNACLTDWS